ncbi:MAG: hypothetical protein ACWGO1_13545 [Anaerolineales bacterium]
MRSQLYLQFRLLRRRLRRWQALLHWRRLSFVGVPVLFANSFPKSGTHLLTQVLQGFAQLGPAVDSGLPAIVTYNGSTGRERPVSQIQNDLQRLLPGDIAYGHLHALSPVIAQLSQPGSASYFILRDPRDVVVSHVHYVTEIETSHIHHTYYTQELKDFDQRLRTSILGLPGELVPFPDISQRFAPYLGWLKRPEVLILRFEDFLQDQERALSMVLEHAVQRGFPLAVDRREAIHRLADSIDPQRSPTFRSGKIGGWKTSFSPENKQLFKDVAADLLIQLGYEKDTDW